MMHTGIAENPFHLPAAFPSGFLWPKTFALAGLVTHRRCAPASSCLCDTEKGTRGCQLRSVSLVLFVEMLPETERRSKGRVAAAWKALVSRNPLTSAGALVCFGLVSEKHEGLASTTEVSCQSSQLRNRSGCVSLSAAFSSYI